MGTNSKKYWSENLRLMAILLSVWFLVSFGFGIILVDALNGVEIAGFKLGFWFAQQGSIFTFVALIFIYVALMNRLDRKHGLEEVADDKPDAPPQQS